MHGVYVVFNTALLGNNTPSHELVVNTISDHGMLILNRPL